MRCFNCFVTGNEFDWLSLSIIPNRQQRLLVSAQHLLPLMTTIMTKKNDEDHESNNVDENHDKQQSANSNISLFS
jgi:hypothetical protein